MGWKSWKGCWDWKGWKRLEVSNLDYRLVDIPSDSVVYADPPYRGTECKAYADFSPEEFDAWLSVVPAPVYVSEFTCPDGCVEIARRERVTSMAATTSSTVTEQLYIQERFAENRYVPPEQMTMMEEVDRK